VESNCADDQARAVQRLGAESERIDSPDMDADLAVSLGKARAVAHQTAERCTRADHHKIASGAAKTIQRAPT
jgi:hypothetical protein